MNLHKTGHSRQYSSERRVAIGQRDRRIASDCLGDRATGGACRSPCVSQDRRRRGHARRCLHGGGRIRAHHGRAWTLSAHPAKPWSRGLWLKASSRYGNHRGDVPVAGAAHAAAAGRSDADWTVEPGTAEEDSSLFALADSSLRPTEIRCRSCRRDQAFGLNDPTGDPARAAYSHSASVTAGARQAQSSRCLERPRIASARVVPFAASRPGHCRPRILRRLAACVQYLAG
jgi:hypothetical protein